MRVSMIVVASAFAVALAVSARPAYACSCVYVEGCTAIRATDVVFEATVESITPEPPPVPGRPHHRYIVRLTDIRAWRGKPESTIFMDKSGSTCDYQFTAGTRYVIHANVIAEGYLGVSTCSMTTAVAAATEVLACVKPK